MMLVGKFVQYENRRMEASTLPVGMNDYLMDNVDHVALGCSLADCNWPLLAYSVDLGSLNLIK